MRANLFTGSPWAISPFRPARLGQSCPVDGTCPPPTDPDTTTTATTQEPPKTAASSSFPIVPVAIGAGALLLLAGLLRG